MYTIIHVMRIEMNLGLLVTPAKSKLLVRYLWISLERPNVDPWLASAPSASTLTSGAEEVKTDCSTCPGWGSLLIT